MKLKYLGYFLLVLIFVSCQPYSIIQIETLSPAEIQIPTKNKNLAILNNGLYYKNSMENDSLKQQHYLYDSVAVSESFNALQRVLGFSPLFENASIDIYLAEPLYDSAYLKPFPVNQISNYCPQGKDLLLSMDFLYRNTDKKSKKHNDGYFNGRIVNYYELEHKAFYYSIWRLYECDKNSMLKQWIIKDTLIWRSEGLTLTEALELIPSEASSSIETGYQMGEIIGFKIAPYWKSESRFYYTVGSPAMRKAAKYAERGDYESAAELWLKMSHSNDAFVASKAYFNLALYFEITNNYIQAIKMALESYKLVEDDRTKDYVQMLSQRRTNEKLVQRQLILE